MELFENKRSFAFIRGSNFPFRLMALRAIGRVRGKSLPLEI
jgi:hypothetical protein